MPQPIPTRASYSAQNEAGHLQKPLESGIGGVNSLLCVSACWEGCGSLEAPGKCSPFSRPAVPLLSLTVCGDIMVCSLKGHPCDAKARRAKGACPWSCPHPKAQNLPLPLAPRCALESGEFLIKTPLLGMKVSAVFQEFGILAKSSQPAVLNSNTLFPTVTVRSLPRSFTWVTN